MDFLTRGHMLADVSAIIGSLDIVFGEIDRLTVELRSRIPPPWARMLKLCHICGRFRRQMTWTSSMLHRWGFQSTCVRRVWPYQRRPMRAIRRTGSADRVATRAEEA